MNDLLTEAVKSLESFFEQDDRWFQPFPMGVFGTLRLGCCNQRLMGAPEHKPSRFGLHYSSHHRAFMPHFSASGLSIHHSPESSAVFEVFTYIPDQWRKMIGPVDGLEGFRPGRDVDWGYQRTLAWLHILPEDFEHDLYDVDPWGRGERDLGIPKETWDQFPRVPCWVYSSVRQNGQSSELDDSPIIWYG